MRRKKEKKVKKKKMGFLRMVLYRLITRHIDKYMTRKDIDIIETRISDCKRLIDENKDDPVFLSIAESDLKELKKKLSKLNYKLKTMEANKDSKILGKFTQEELSKIR